MIVSYGSEGGSSFFLHNAFSTPELRDAKKDPHFAAKRMPDTNTQVFRLSYPGADIAHAVLENSLDDTVVDARHPLDGDPWDVPFFYGDARHVFYVSTVQNLVMVPDWTRFGVEELAPSINVKIPPMVFMPSKTIPDPVGPVAKQPGFGVVDPAPLEHVIGAQLGIKRGIGTLGTVRFGDRNIGPTGAQPTTLRRGSGGTS